MTAFDRDLAKHKEFLDWLATADAFAESKGPPQRQEPFEPAGLVEVAEGFAIDPGLLILARRFRSSRGEMLALFEAMPPGADTARIARLLMLWAFERAAPSVMDRISNAEMRDWAQGVIAMHKRAIDGDTISARDWRVVRNALPKIPSAGQVELTAVEAVRASAWDLVAMPGAWEDFAGYCFYLTEAVVQDEDGWNWEDGRSMLNEAMLAVKAAKEGQGDPDGEPSPELVHSRKEWERVATLLAEHSNRVDGASSALRSRGIEMLFSLIEEASIEAAA